MRTCRDDPRIFPDVGDTGIFQLLFQPSELVCKLLAHGPGHLEFEEKGAGRGVADKAIELTEIAEIGGDGITDFAEHWHVHQHPERRNTRGPAREGAWLSLPVIPVCEGVVPAHGNLYGSLFAKVFDRHGKILTEGRTLFRCG